MGNCRKAHCHWRLHKIRHHRHSHIHRNMHQRVVVVRDRRFSVAPAALKRRRHGGRIIVQVILREQVIDLAANLSKQVGARKIRDIFCCLHPISTRHAGCKVQGGECDAGCRVQDESVILRLVRAQSQKPLEADGKQMQTSSWLTSKDPLKTVPARGIVVNLDDVGRYRCDTVCNTSAAIQRGGCGRR